MKVGYAFVAIHHREIRAGFVGFENVGFDCGLLIGWKFLDFRNQIAEAVVEIDVERCEHSGMLGDEVFEEYFDCVVKKMMGSLTFIMVAFMCRENRTPEDFA